MPFSPGAISRATFCPTPCQSLKSAAKIIKSHIWWFCFLLPYQLSSEGAGHGRGEDPSSCNPPYNPHQHTGQPTSEPRGQAHRPTPAITAYLYHHGLTATYHRAHAPSFWLITRTSRYLTANLGNFKDENLYFLFSFVFNSMSYTKYAV